MQRVESARRRYRDEGLGSETIDVTKEERRMVGRQMSHDSSRGTLDRRPMHVRVLAHLVCINVAPALPYYH